MINQDASTIYDSQSSLGSLQQYKLFFNKQLRQFWFRMTSKKLRNLLPLFMLEGLIISLNTLYLFEIVEHSAEDDLEHQEDNIRLSYVLLVFGTT